MANIRTIAITGASSGIGAALTRALAADGHKLYVCARREDRLAEVTENGRLAKYMRVDVACENEVAGFAQMVEKDAGHVDVVICCAGSYGTIGPVCEVDARLWWNSVEANLYGTFLTVQKFVYLLNGRPNAQIIGFSGGGAFNPLPRYSAYATAKAGTVRLLETMAEELKPMGIAVNSVAPGFVKTEIHDATLSVGPETAGGDFHAMTKAKLKRGAVPIEVPIECVRWLISASANTMTGKTISASFDPWGSPEFVENIDAINASDLYTMRRLNLVDLPPEQYVDALSCAAKFEPKNPG